MSQKFEAAQDAVLLALNEKTAILWVDHMAGTMGAEALSPPNTMD